MQLIKMKKICFFLSQFILGLFCLFLICNYYSTKLLALDPDKHIDQYLVNKWKISDGLPSNSITSICQTDDHYLWIGTNKGLVKFDGIRFEIINIENDPKKKHICITDLFVDRQGTLWIGSLDGLFQFKNWKFRKFTIKDGLSGNDISCINEDINGNLWIGTIDNYLNKFEDGKFIVFNSSNSMEGRSISSIFDDSAGVLWVGAYKDGLFKFKSGKFIKRNISGLKENHSINSVYEDRKNCLWRGTDVGLMQIDGERTHLYTTLIGGISSNNVVDILEDYDGNLWVGTTDGITRIKRYLPDNVYIENYFKNNVITSLFEDNEKNIWIGTNGSGVMRLRDSVFTMYKTKDGLANDFISSLFQDRNGDIWIGSGYSLCMFKNGTFSKFLIKSANSKNTINEDSKGNLWVGTNGSGLFKIKNEVIVNFTTMEGLLSNIIKILYIDSKENLWVGTNKGLNCYNNSIFKSYTIKNGLLSNSINSVLEDKKHNLWVGTSKGISFVKNGIFKKENIKQFLKNIPISFVYEDKKNTFWICTFGKGLKRFKNRKFDSFSIYDGLYSNNIYKIIEDIHGNFWISSDSGVLKVNKEELNEFAKGNVNKINCILYGLSDGMGSVECSIGSCSTIRTKEGELWFATKKGISAVNPGKLKVDKLPLRVIIEKVLLNKKSILRNKKHGSFYDIKEVQFYFTAPTFVSPEKVKFKYKLDGYDKDWVMLEPGKERAALYLGLKSGVYTFRVQACNKDGIWNKNGDSVSFSLKTSFFKTYIFKILCLFVFVLIGISLYFWAKRIIDGKRIKYKTSTLNQNRLEEYLKKLIYSMEVEKVYLDEDISLHTLAEKLSMNSYHLSQLINEKLNKNFYDFVNHYRVKEAKKKLTACNNDDTKILRIAYEVGFNSKSAFNRAFKKFTNKTPSQYKSEYIKKIKKKNN